jgi:hypothetical protein
MKKVKRLLGLITSLVMLASTIPANAAETSTRVFFDDFESEASMSEYVIDESNSPYAVWLNDGKLKINQRRGAKKTFDTPYTGMVAVEYDAGMNELVNNVMDIGLTAADGKACVFRLILKDYLYVRGEDGTQWSTLSWAAPDVITKNLSDTLNHVKVAFDFGKQEIYVTVSNENGTKTEMVGKFPVKMKAVTYINMMDNKDTNGGWQNHTYFDNVEVWQRDIPTLPEYTYLKNDFTNLSGDYFGGDLYSTVKYAVDSNQGSRYPTDAAATDPIATSLIKFENGAMEVGNGYTDPSTQATSNYCAVIELPEQINNEMVELSFKARMKDPTAQGKFGKVALFAKGVAYGISMHWEGGKPNEVRFNHQYGQENKNGFKLALPEGLHEYKFLIDNVNDHYSLFVDGEYKGYYNVNGDYKLYCTSAESQTHLRLVLSNVIIDDVVVKDAPLLTQYYYTGYREYVEGEIKDWLDVYTQTGENQYGHNSVHKMTDFFYSKYYGTVVKIANPTNLDKTAVVFNALYDPTGKLVSVVMSDQKKLNTVEANGTSITEFSVTHDLRMPGNLTNYTSKTIVMESLDTLKPLYDAIVLD